MQNIFAPETGAVGELAGKTPQKKIPIPDYDVSPSALTDHIVAFVIGFAAGAVVLFFFYKIVILSLIGGAIGGIVNIFLASDRQVEKRKKKLRAQFFDMLEAMSVSMRAGNPPLKALESAREDLSLIYDKNSDIMKELDLIIGRFYHGVPLSDIFEDFAERSGLEDIHSFASVYATIEGKSSRADEIIQDTQQIIADKMEIEMEIETLMTAAKTEVNVMLVMPIVILGVIGYVGAGFMDAIYTTAGGRLTATLSLVVFILCYIMAKKLTNIDV